MQLYSILSTDGIEWRFMPRTVMEGVLISVHSVHSSVTAMIETHPVKDEIWGS